MLAINMLSIIFYSSLLIGTLPSHAIQTQRNFQCANSLSFILSSEGDIRDAFRVSGVYLKLKLKGKNYSMISAQGADNTRFYGTDNDYSVISWGSVSLLKGNKYIGEKCR